MTKQMPIKEYCEWLEVLTARGDTINAKGLQDWIEQHAKEKVKEVTINLPSHLMSKEEQTGYNQAIKDILNNSK